VVVLIVTSLVNFCVLLMLQNPEGVVALGAYRVT